MQYAQRVQQLDALDEEPFASNREARLSIQQAQGIEKVRLWLENRIQEPRFDDPAASMPNLGITQDQAEILSAYLSGAGIEVEQREEHKGVLRRAVDGVRGWFPAATRANAKKYGLVLFGVGLVVGGITALTAYWVFVRVRRRRGGEFS